MSYKIAQLSGDGIGIETTQSAIQILQKSAQVFGFDLQFEQALIGGCAIDDCGCPLPKNTLELAKSADAVLLGSVGGYKWDNAKERPESALLSLRKELGLYANIRPAKLFDCLIEHSALKAETAKKGIDLVTVRELTGGIYFGERGFRQGIFGREAYDTEAYSEIEIERVARVAFELAEERKHKLCLVDKANVLTTSKLWRKIVADINEDYPSVSVSAMYVDNASMQLVLNPSQFDVILTSNMFGDILSDLTGAIVGSIGIMPSASLGAFNVGMYEAIHGSAPDIAGKNIANPIGEILSAAMMMRHSFNQENVAVAIENAVKDTLDANIRTADLGGTYSTTQITDEIAKRIR